LDFFYFITHTVPIAAGLHAFIDLPAWFLSDVPILVAGGALDSGVAGAATGVRPDPALTALRGCSIVIFSVSTNARVLEDIGKSLEF
jgi:hypothetical protein